MDKLVDAVARRAVPVRMTLADLLVSNPRGDGTSPLKYGQSVGELKGTGPGESANPMTIAKDGSYAGTLEDRIAQGVFDGGPAGLPVAAYYGGQLAGTAAKNAEEGDYAEALKALPELAMFVGPGRLSRTKGIHEADLPQWIGPDGVVRAETPMGHMEPKFGGWNDLGNIVREGNGNITVGDVIDAPELGSMYPEALGTRIMLPKEGKINGPYPVHYRAPGQTWVDHQQIKNASPDSVKSAVARALQSKVGQVEGWQATVKSPSLHPGYENMRATGEYLNDLHARLQRGERADQILATIEYPEIARHYLNTRSPSGIADAAATMMQAGVPATSKEVNFALNRGEPLPSHAQAWLKGGKQDIGYDRLPRWRIDKPAYNAIMGQRDTVAQRLWPEVLTRNAVRRDMNPALAKTPVRSTEDVSPVDIFMRVNSY